MVNSTLASCQYVSCRCVLSLPGLILVERNESPLKSWWLTGAPPDLSAVLAGKFHAPGSVSAGASDNDMETINTYQCFIHGKNNTIKCLTSGAAMCMLGFGRIPQGRRHGASSGDLSS